MRKGYQEATCLNCGKKFEYSIYASKGKYCSNKCQAEYQRKEKIKNGTACWGVIREAVKERANHRCEICGLSTWLGKPIKLICDHIDGDPYNNSLDNLRAICSNCDATLPTYKALNKGRGRKLNAR